MNNVLDFIKAEDAWDKLSMREKAEMMKVAVRNGIYNLNDIREKYNEFAEGGSVDTDWSYNSWKRQIAEHMGIRPDEDNTYDYEAYFKKYPEEAWKMLKGDPTAHFSDEFKTVYHPTFSSKSIGNDGSIYSGVRKPKTNPQGLVGGTWSPDYHTFTMSPDGYKGPVSMDDRKWYLENAEDNGVQLREADGSLPIYDGIPWGGVLPNITIYGSKHSLGGPLVEAVMNEYKKGGNIYIKPSHRGRLTELKKRTGKTEAELYRTGGPAVRKMITFARNARKRKHGLGGNLFDGTTQPTQKMQIGLNVQGWPDYSLEEIVAYGDENEKRRKAIQDAYLNFVTESNDATAVANGRPQNQHLVDKAVRGAKANAAWEKEHPNLTAWSYLPSTAVIGTALAPLGTAGWSGLTSLGDAAAATSAGQAITAGLAPLATTASTSVAGAPLYTWADVGLSSLFGGHGVQTAIDEGGISPTTALELLPVTRVAKPAVEMGYNAAKPVIDRTVTTLQNNYPALFDPHTSWDATLGYHGDNIFSRAIGTVGRRYGYTPKAGVPEFHRRLTINRPSQLKLDEEGNMIISSGRTGEGHDGIVNFATSEPARGHSSHKSLSGIDDYIIDSKAIGNQDFKSIQPSDTFFETGQLAVDPKSMTLVSGNTEMLDYARSLGMRTLSSPRLRQLTASRMTKEDVINSRSEGIAKFLQNVGKIKYGKGQENAGQIGEEMQRLTSMRGTPTMQDYSYFEGLTGLNSGVRPAEMWNGTKEQGLELFGGWGKPRRTPTFNHVAYAPASNIEKIYREAKMGTRPWEDYYAALENMPSARQQLGLNSAMDTYLGETPAAEWARAPQITAENTASYTPKVNWDADNWFKTISGRGSYSSEEAAELASHVPEYRNIERRLFNEGKLVSDADGSIIVKDSDMSPQEYIMRQSEAFQKMNPEHHYVGVSKGKIKDFEEGNISDFDSWTTRTSPKDVEEYAISPQGGHTINSEIEKIRHQMQIREENFELHQEQLKWKLDHNKISQEEYDQSLKSLKENFTSKQQEEDKELRLLIKHLQTDPLNGGKVFDITFPLDAKVAPTIDAQGAHWQYIPYENNGRPITTSTDHIVSTNKKLGYDVSSIDNVMDTFDGTLLNESIIHRGTPVKSVLGNTGTFDIKGPNKYRRFRGLIPWIGGLSTLGIGSSMLIEDNYYSR